MTIRTQAVEVEAVGRAVGNNAAARDQALADALRQAVRQGAGVEIDSRTKETGFVLSYDHIFAVSCGYVSQFKVLSSVSSLAGIEVKVRAEVATGAPDNKDDLAMRHIVSLKGQPRLAVEVHENIEGLKQTDFAKTWFTGLARDSQLRVVEYSDSISPKDAGGLNESSERTRAFAENSPDYIVRVDVRGKHNGQGTLDGTATQRFSLSVDLSIEEPETHEIVAAIPVPSRDMESKLVAPEAAGRDCLQKLLGEADSRPAPAQSLLRKLFLRWISELDLGSNHRLEFQQILQSEWDVMLGGLREAADVSSVTPVKFDRTGPSLMEVLTTLNSERLEATVAGVATNQFELAAASRRVLKFSHVVNRDFVKDQLAPWGTWTNLPTLGSVWQPSPAVLTNSPEWRPYYDGGKFVDTQNGPFWNSDYQWGDIPFHYGRWAHTSAGWVWVPDYTWAPAWVAWRSSDTDGAVGWAPIPPGAEAVNGNLTYRGVTVTAETTFGLSERDFVFVHADHIHEHIMRFIRETPFHVPQQQTRQFFFRSTPHTELARDAHGRFINRGIGPDHLHRMNGQLTKVALIERAPQGDNRHLETKSGPIVGLKHVPSGPAAQTQDIKVFVPPATRPLLKPAPHVQSQPPKPPAPSAGVKSQPPQKQK